ARAEASHELRLRSGAAVVKPTGLRFEHGPDVLGVTERSPRLSWLLPPGSTRQEAYEIEATGWSSGRVDDPESTYVPWGGPPLASRRRVEWRVRVWTDLGESDWSDPAWWETGLLESADWQASFVAPAED